MIQVSKVIAQGRGLASALLKRAATVELDWDVRQKEPLRRHRFSTGRERRHLSAARHRAVRGGDVLVAEDGSLVRVLAAPQPVLVITAIAPSTAAAFDLTRARRTTWATATCRIELQAGSPEDSSPTTCWPTCCAPCT
jgi:urease accessory protein